MTNSAIALWLSSDQQQIAEELTAYLSTNIQFIGTSNLDTLDSWTNNQGFQTESDIRIFLSRCASENVLPILLAPDSLQNSLNNYLNEINIQAISIGSPSEENIFPSFNSLVQILPLFRLSNGGGQLQDALEGFGEIESISINMTSRSNESNTWSLLIECIDLLNRHLGIPEKVYAVSCRDRGRSNLINEINGPITANLKYPDSRSGSFTIVSGSARKSSSVNFYSKQGNLFASESYCIWSTPDGFRDYSEIPKQVTNPNISFAHELGRQIKLTLEKRLRIQEPIRWNEIFCTANALGLSIQTGDAEIVPSSNL